MISPQISNLISPISALATILQRKVHHYLDFMERDDFDAARENIKNLAMDYLFVHREKRGPPPGTYGKSAANSGVGSRGTVGSRTYQGANNNARTTSNTPVAKLFDWRGSNISGGGGVNSLGDDENLWLDALFQPSAALYDDRLPVPLL
jgi:hypothetical protein